MKTPRLVESLASGCIGRVDGLDLRLNLDVLLNRLRSQFGSHARRFGDPNHNVGEVASGKPSTLDAHGVSSDRQKRSGEGTIGTGFDRALGNFRGLVGDAHFGVRYECPARILHDSGNGTRCTALGDCLCNERERSEADPNQPLYWARHSVLPTAEHGTCLAAPDLSVVLGNLGLPSSERIMPCAP